MSLLLGLRRQRCLPKEVTDLISQFTFLNQPHSTRIMLHAIVIVVFLQASPSPSMMWLTPFFPLLAGFILDALRNSLSTMKRFIDAARKDIELLGAHTSCA